MTMELKTNTAIRIPVGPLVNPTDGKTAEVALTVTALSVQIYQLKTDGTAVVRSQFAPTDPDVSAGDNDMILVTSSTDGMYDLELTAANINFYGNARLSVYDVDGFLVWWVDIHVVSANYFNNKYGTTIQEVNLKSILGTALTETSSLLAGGFKKFFNVSSPTGTLNSIPDAVPGATGGNLIAGTNAATSITTALTANITGNLSGSIGTVAANGITTTSMATDSIDTGSLKADAVTKIQNGLATPKNITAGTITTVTTNSDMRGTNSAATEAKQDLMQIDMDTLVDDQTLPKADYLVEGDTIAGVTTVTNLTNAATNGDLTAAMKASVNAEVDNAWDTAIGTPTVGSRADYVKRMKFALCNRWDITEATGASDIFADDSLTSFSAVAEAFTTLPGVTLRKKII